LQNLQVDQIGFELHDGLTGGDARALVDEDSLTRPEEGPDLDVLRLDRSRENERLPFA
jgi:hypothetical protein